MLSTRNKEGKMDMKKFTMFELSLVIAVIAVFAALAMPVIAKAQAEVAEVTCENNQKQIMAAVIAYAADYKGYVVPANLDSLSWNSYIIGMKRTKGGATMGKKSYIKPKSKVFFCPEEPVVTNISYAVNREFFAKGKGLNITIDKINPSLIYLADMSPAAIKTTGSPTFMPKRVSADGKGWGFAYLRHEDKVNVGKIDGSVESLDEKTFKTNNKYWTLAK